MIFHFYHGLQSAELDPGVLSLVSCDDINTLFLDVLGDKDTISRVRLVDAGNMGDAWSGEGGGDGNGIITGCKGVMYCKDSGLNKGTEVTVVLALLPWQRDASCAKKFAWSCSQVSGDVIFLVSWEAHCT